MHRTADMLLEDALAIWQAGVNAVLPDRLIREYVHVDPLSAAGGSALWIDDLEIPLAGVDRIAVVGAGKAGAGMVVALEQVLGETLLHEKRVSVGSTSLRIASEKLHRSDSMRPDRQE